MCRCRLDPEKKIALNKKQSERMKQLRADPVRGLAIKADDIVRIKRWAKENPEQDKASRKKCNKESRKKHPEQHRIANQRRKSVIRGLPTGFRASDWRAAVEHFRGCAYCGVAGKTEQEHFIPAVSSGSFTRDNILPACRRCNREKSTQAALDYLVSKEHGLARYAGILSYFEGLN